MFPFLFPVWTVPLTLVLSCQHVCKDIVEKSPDTWLDMDDCCRSSCDKLSESSHFVVFTNSDHAGCLKTRKSKSSSKLFYGSHLLLSASTTKGVIALSSGTSELCALVEATSTGLGAVSMRKDLGVDISKKKKRKSTKEYLKRELMRPLDRGVAVRRGAGRIAAYCYSPNIVGAKAHKRQHGQNHENPWSVETGRSQGRTP